MNEREFKAKLRRLLKPHCYIQSMSSYATNGTPDLWLSGTRADLWLEVKFTTRPGRPAIPKLTALQKKWLDDRYNEGRNIAVLLGVSTTECMLFLNKEWHEGLYEQKTLSSVIKDIMEFIG